MAMKLVSFVAAVFATCSLCAVAAPRLAFQVYAVRDLCERDFVGTLKSAKAMGYEGVETGRFYGLDAKGLKAATASLAEATPSSASKIIRTVILCRPKAEHRIFAILPVTALSTAEFFGIIRNHEW